jgi:hypothetical protein
MSASVACADEKLLGDVAGAADPTTVATGGTSGGTTADVAHLARHADAKTCTVAQQPG